MKQDKLKTLISKAQTLAKQATEHVSDASKVAKDYWEDNKDEYQVQAREAVQTGQVYLSSS
ncbi:MAG: hypothetical protein JAY74_25505 [Candidatus Thiodiazotropha taylori]|nr:hypothetical protein [Candidatus Thiodiazotropha taylori]